MRHAPRKERLAPPSASGALACRRSTAALAKGTFVAQGSASGHASCDLAGAHDLMDRQPGRRPYALPRALSAPACPSPGFNTRSGHSAGRLMPKAARVARVMSLRPAGTALAPAGRHHPPASLVGKILKEVRFVRVIRTCSISLCSESRQTAASRNCGALPVSVRNSIGSPAASIGLISKWQMASRRAVG